MKEVDSFRNHVNPVLAQLLELTGLNARFVRAEGCHLWDDRGNRYLDLFSGSGTFNLGHNCPEIAQALIRTLSEKPPQLFGVAVSPPMGDLAAMLVNLAGPPLEIVFFSNSGSEAIEGAMKLARAATGRARFAYCENAYHGTTMGSLSLMESGPFRDPFGPLLADCTKIPFNDLIALERILAESDVAAFVVEPIQAEGGIRLPEPDYLRRAWQLCRDSGTLLVLDEVQTGLGRTGPLFAFQDESLTPDVVVLAKSLGGGIMPIGAYLTSREIQERAYGTYALCESHHTTFGGNTLACRAAEAALELLAAPALQDHVRAEGTRFLASIRTRLEGHPLVREIRGRGLLIGIEFAPLNHPQLQWQDLGVPEFAARDMAAQLVMKRLFRAKILTQTCVHSWSVLKLEPPLVVERHHLEECLDALAEAVEWLAAL